MPTPVTSIIAFQCSKIHRDQLNQVLYQGCWALMSLLEGLGNHVAWFAK
uniref:Uncharacterized protein n=1 Tax=Arundo donax TaxID=35708 RepID=A0A0A9FCG4_ARUDO